MAQGTIDYFGAVWITVRIQGDLLKKFFVFSVFRVNFRVSRQTEVHRLTFAADDE